MIYKIRPFKEEDKNKIIDFTRDLYESGYIPSLLNAHKNHPEKTIPFVFEENGVIKGLCFLHISTKDDGWLMGMRVKKEYQREGVALTFTGKMIAYSKEKGLKWVGLNADPKNKTVQRLTKRLKFTKTEIYQIYEFEINMFSQLIQKNPVELYEINKKNEIKNYFKIRKVKKLYFIIVPGFIWFRITDSILDSLIYKKRFYLFNNNLITLQRTGSYIVVNVFGKYDFSEYLNFLSQLYKEYPKNAEGRIIFCVKHKNAKGLKQFFNKITSPVDIAKRKVITSTWVVYGKLL